MILFTSCKYSGLVQKMEVFTCQTEATKPNQHSQQVLKGPTNIRTCKVPNNTQKRKAWLRRSLLVVNNELIRLRRKRKRMRGVWRFLYISLLHPFSLPSTQPPCEVEGTPHPPETPSILSHHPLSQTLSFHSQEWSSSNYIYIHISLQNPLPHFWNLAIKIINFPLSPESLYRIHLNPTNFPTNRKLEAPPKTQTPF